MSRTPQALRKLARELSDTHGCRVEATHESGRQWHLDWTDGPTEAEVRAQVEKVAPEAEVRPRRRYTPRAWVLSGLRALLAGETDRYISDGSHLAWAAELRLATSPTPARVGPDEERLDAMTNAHLARTPPGAAGYEEELLLEPLLMHGVAPLLIPRQAKLDGTDVLTMTPAEHLTARYARGEDAWSWTHRLRTLPAPDLVAAAQADADLDLVGRLAVLGLLEQMRRLWENTEAAAFAAARDAAAPGGAGSWPQIGAVLGITKQGAYDRARRRATGGPSRLA